MNADTLIDLAIAAVAFGGAWLFCWHDHDNDQPPDDKGAEEVTAAELAEWQHRAAQVARDVEAAAARRDSLKFDQIIAAEYPAIPHQTRRTEEDQ